MTGKDGKDGRYKQQQLTSSKGCLNKSAALCWGGAQSRGIHLSIVAHGTENGFKKMR